jgi:hypothetical protein
MTEEDVAEYVEKMKDKPRKQIHHSGYKPKWHVIPTIGDLSMITFGITGLVILILALLGVI